MFASVKRLLHCSFIHSSCLLSFSFVCTYCNAFQCIYIYGIFTLFNPLPSPLFFFASAKYKKKKRFDKFTTCVVALFHCIITCRKQDRVIMQWKWWYGRPCVVCQDIYQTFRVNLDAGLSHLTAVPLHELAYHPWLHYSRLVSVISLINTTQKHNVYINQHKPSRSYHWKKYHRCLAITLYYFRSPYIKNTPDERSLPCMNGKGQIYEALVRNTDFWDFHSMLIAYKIACT